MLLPLAPEPFTAPTDRDMLASERREFVRTHRTCIFGYARRHDGPSMSVVYYVPTDGDEMLVSTMADRSKALAVARDPKVSLCVLDERWPFAYLQVYADAVVDDDPELVVDVMMAVGERMSGQPLGERPVRSSRTWQRRSDGWCSAAGRTRRSPSRRATSTTTIGQKALHTGHHGAFSGGPLICDGPVEDLIERTSCARRGSSVPVKERHGAPNPNVLGPYAGRHTSAMRCNPTPNRRAVAAVSSVGTASASSTSTSSGVSVGTTCASSRATTAGIRRNRTGWS
jgi:Pyridoxamine 5'-phosphate oxidase